MPEPLHVIPTIGVIFTGPVGGPFGPSSQVFTLTNSGAGPLSWSVVNTSPWLNVTPSSGILATGGPAGSITLTLTPAASNLTAGSYQATLWFTNLNNRFAQSRKVTLAVVTPPVITVQPDNQALLEGETAEFTVGTASNALLYFQWQQDNGDSMTNLTASGRISGSTANTLVISNASIADQGAYSVIVSNAAGVAVSDPAYLAILPWRPVITQQPVSQTVLPGAPAAFSVAAVGTHPFTYRWRLNGVSLEDNSNISGSATDTLRILSPNSATAGRYSVIVSNALGSTLSLEAALNLTPVTITGSDMTCLFSFTNGNSGGAAPYSPLVQAGDGNFYGTTTQSGTNWGTVFRLTTNGKLTTLHTFVNYSDGAMPYAGLLLATNGYLYGTTAFGGAHGDGTVFRIATNGAFLTLASFTGLNGDYSVAGLVQGTDGNFYGTTLYGGIFGNGNVFRVTPNGTITSLISFDGINGASPSCVLVHDSGGNFYGTTEEGGADGDGTVFQLAPSGQLTTLVSFNYNNGAYPIPGLVLDADGNLYGTTEYGGAYGYGTVFKVTPDPTLQTLYSFGYDQNGAYPYGGLMLSVDGNLYGTTENGGTYDAGTVFRITTGGSLVTLAQFDNYQGAQPAAALVLGQDYNLYGTATSGGATGYGSVYRLSISGALEITSQPGRQMVYLGDTASFNVATFGSLPVAYQWQKGGTNLTDGNGISGSTSRVLTITNVSLTNVGTYSVIVSNAFGSLTSSNGLLQLIISPPFITEQPADLSVLVGATAVFSVDVVGDMPLAYQWQKNGTNLTNGGRISGALSSVLTISRATDDDDGAYPWGGLVQASDGNFYGTTEEGGSHYAGNIFRISPAGVLASLYSFTGTTDGAVPVAALIQGRDGNLYGTTYEGGTGGMGTVFKVTTNGTLTTLHAFNYSDGARPYAGLMQGSDGTLYGSTELGGLGEAGTVFKITTNGALTTLVHFTGSNGASPEGTLIQANDGYLYGTTYYGGSGTGNRGVVFRLAIPVLPQITAQPTNALAFLGADVSFSVSASGTAPVSYQWRFNGTNLTDNGNVAGSTTPTLSLANVSVANAGAYSVVVSNPAGWVASASAALTVTSSPPLITLQPTNQTVQPSSTVLFTVAATGNLPLSYQWQHAATDLIDGGHVLGAHTTSLAISNASSRDAGSYSVIISNSAGWMPSASATLSVLPLPSISAALALQSPGSHQFALTWTSVVGETFQVQYTLDLTSAGWTDLGNPITAASNTVSATDFITTNSQVFYRVLLLPAGP